MLAVSKEEVGVGVGCAPRRAVWLKQKAGVSLGVGAVVGAAMMGVCTGGEGGEVGGVGFQKCSASLNMFLLSSR